MAVTALEIILNGKKLYTVGMEGWQMLGATINGHRHTKEMMEEIMARAVNVPPGIEMKETESLNLSCHVGLPDPGRLGSSSGQGYGAQPLTVGDEVTIRVIESDKPDLPAPPVTGDGQPIVSIAASNDGVER